MIIDEAIKSLNCVVSLQDCIIQENGEEILENLSNEEERKAVYDAFQKSYKEAIGKK